MRKIDTSRSIELIYDAITRPELWSEVVESLVRDTGSNSGLLSVERRDHSAVLAYSDYGFDDAAMDAYAEYFVAKDIWLDGLSARPFNQFHLSHEVTPQKEFLNSEIYNDWGKWHDVHHATGVYINSRDDVVLRFAVQRSKKEGEYSRGEQQALDRIAPHLRRAITVHDELFNLKALNNSSSRILDQMPFAAFLLNEKCVIQYRNAGADELLRTAAAFSEKGNVLSVRDPYKRDFEKLTLHCVLAGQGHDITTGGAFQIKSTSEGPVYEVSVTPLVVDDFRLCFQYRRILALVIIREVALVKQLPERITDMYKLTGTESEVARLLCIGLSASQIAGELGRSFHTIRTHIKNILEKTETGSQKQLVVKLLSGITSFSRR